MGQPYQPHWGREVIEKNWEEKNGTGEIEFQFSVLLRKVSMTPARIRETASRTSPIIQDLRESEFRVPKNHHIYIHIQSVYRYTFSAKKTGRNNLFKTCKPTLTCPISCHSSSCWHDRRACSACVGY